MSVVHEIVTDADGVQHGTDGTLTVSLLDAGGRMFKRRAIRGGDTPQEACWLVTELNGVRVYQCDSHVIVTTQDIYP